MNNHQKFMKEALKEARKSQKKGAFLLEPYWWKMMK